MRQSNSRNNNESRQQPHKTPQPIAAMDTKSAFECSDSSTSLSSRDVADPWNGSTQCYQGLFHFVNEAYDLGFRVNQQKQQHQSRTQQSLQQPRQSSRPRRHQEQEARTQERQQQPPVRRNGRLEFIPSVSAQDPSVANRLQQRYLQFSVAPERFRQSSAVQTNNNEEDRNDALVGLGVPLF